MPDDLIKYSDAIRDAEAASLNTSDVFAIAQEDAGSPTGYSSKATKLLAIANEVVKGINYSSDLQTTSKTVIGAINEVNTKASQFDNMTATASGAIATFSNGGDDIPVSEFECDIVAQQASGTPTPTSPLPITGHSGSDIVVCGVNIWDEEWELGQYDINTGEKATNNNAIRSKNLIPIKPNQQVYFKIPNGVRVYFYGRNKNYLGGGYSYVIASSQSITFSNPNAYYFTFYTGNTATYGNNISINYPSTDTQYHAYTGNLYTVAFGQTIYGGRLIYANGQWSIQATFGYAEFDGSVDEDWIMSGGANGTFIIAVNNAKLVNTTIAGDVISNIMTAISYNTGYSSSNIFGISMGYQSSQLRVNVDTSIVTKDLTTFRNWLSNNNLQAVYELATPVIIPITSATRVKTISGDNNIFSSTGDCEVKYFTNKADSLAELIKAFVL